MRKVKIGVKAHRFEKYFWKSAKHLVFGLAPELRPAGVYYIGGAGAAWPWPLLQLVAARRVTTL